MILSFMLGGRHGAFRLWFFHSAQPRMDTNKPSAAKPQTKRGLCTFPSFSVPLCLCGGTSYGNHLRNQEFNHRDAEDTEIANNMKYCGHEFNHRETDQPKFLPKIHQLSSLWYE